MISIEEFRKYGHDFIDWMADYYKNIETYPVKSQVKPGDIKKKIPGKAPEKSESIDNIFRDFREIIMPGMTHWQSPSWMAYFQANSSYPSVLAEMLTATLGAQCMMWDTSPSAAELEEMMMLWLQKAMGIPDHMHGVIQDTASTATLCALLTAREKYSDFHINKQGFAGDEKFRIYCSTETHSSIDKAVKIAGFGHENLVKVAVNDAMEFDPDRLDEAIRKDISKGNRPLCVVATIGTTGTMAIDPLKPLAEICRHYGIWLHVDGAYVGSAMVLPEYRWMIEGLELADSYVFNPHKWLFTNFDLSAYYVREKNLLIKTFSVMPEYLKTAVDQEVNNYRDWGIQLGRRFRALKLWFVLRNFGLEEIRRRLRSHISIVQSVAEEIRNDPDFEILAPVPLNMVCFRYNPGDIRDNDKLNRINKKLLNKVNGTGKVYMTHTRINGQFAIRLVAGQTYVEEKHVQDAWNLIREHASGIE